VRAEALRDENSWTEPMKCFIFDVDEEFTGFICDFEE
jgi:hypothetical protein